MSSNILCIEQGIVCVGADDRGVHSGAVSGHLPSAAHLRGGWSATSATHCRRAVGGRVARRRTLRTLHHRQLPSLPSR